MKKTKNAGIWYVVYLFGIMIFLLILITCDGASISLSKISNATDPYTLIFVVGICLLSLICTKMLIPFKNAICYIIFRNNEFTTKQLKASMLSVKVVFISALLGGGIGFVGQIINFSRSMDTDLAIMGSHIIVALISCFYGMVICIVLLPVYVLLKQSTLQD